MNNTTHTPGPWMVDEWAIGEKLTPQLVVRTASEDCLACVQELMAPSFDWEKAHLRRHTEREANARLIAAAPELLAALQKAVRALNAAPRFRVDGTDSYAIAAECDRAIAKAEGRS